jgi:peptidoglycan/LPS O-acetylase OafA/YrhL
MRAARLGVGALGVAATAYGLVLLLGLGTDQLVAVLVWVVGGIVAHDGLLAPLVVALGVLAAVRAPSSWRTPLLWVLVVLGPLSLVAVPVLGRFGAKVDNPTLLDRPYWLGHAVVVTLVLASTTAWTVVEARRTRRAG